MKNLYFISGLPRSGSTMISNILKQNPKIHAEPVSSLASIFASTHANWDIFDTNKEYPNELAKVGVLSSILEGYYKHIDKPFIFDKDRQWVYQIGLVETILQKKVKILCMVRNPAEILASFEKLRKNNPTYFVISDQHLKENSSIASRAYYIANPSGSLGIAHTAIKDAVIMGYLDRLLFVDYGRYCNSPKSQTKRIYDFFELPYFEHDFGNIDENNTYNHFAAGYPNLHKVKPKLEKTTINCVEYLGLDLYQQYNREIFWDAWI